MKTTSVVTIILIIVFISSSAWLGWSVYRIQQDGAAGKPLRGMHSMDLSRKVQELTEAPSLSKAMELLPQVRELHAGNDEYFERNLLSIVLYYCATMDADHYHEYLREALPLLMSNYRTRELSQARTGELLINFLAMSLREAEFSKWKRDLLTMEPYLARELDLLAVSLWRETDNQQRLEEVAAKYIAGDIESPDAKSMAFKIHCMLNQYDLASQYEADVLDNPVISNSSETEDNTEADLPVIDRFTYLATVNYYLRNARYSEASDYIDSHSNEFLDPSLVARFKAVISAALGRTDSAEFSDLLSLAAQSPFNRMSLAAAEASVYRDLVEFGSKENWNSMCAELYTGNEDDSDLLVYLSYLASVSDEQEMKVIHSDRGTLTLSAIDLAENALGHANTLTQQQHSLMMLCIAYASLASDSTGQFAQERSIAYLDQALGNSPEQSAPMPMSLAVDLAIIVESEAVSDLRLADPAYDQAVSQSIRTYLGRLDAYYGSDPLGLE